MCGKSNMITEADFFHHTIALEDVRLHYVTAGRGDPVVLLHGWPQTWYEWRRIIPALAERYTVIAPDMRGLGDSSKPATGYDKRTVAADIYQLVRKLGFEKIFIVGHDWGGPVAYAYACAHPGDVRKLVILDVAIPGAGLEPLGAQLPGRCVLDGEIVIAKNDGLDFEELQLRIHPAASRVKLLSRQSPASIVFFDLLCDGDRDWRSEPFERRREKLESLLASAMSPIHLTPATREPSVASDW